MQGAAALAAWQAAEKHQAWAASPPVTPAQASQDQQRAYDTYAGMPPVTILVPPAGLIACIS